MIYSAPITYKKGRGLHYTDEGWRLPTVVLTQGEWFALTLGARMLEVYAGTAYEEELQGAIALESPALVEMVQDVSTMYRHDGKTGGMKCK